MEKKKAFMKIRFMAYTKKDSEAMSENLWKIMKKQGF